LDWQVQRDAEHLRLLGIFYYVSAGLSGIGVLVGLIYVGVGVLFGGVAIAEGEGEAALMGVLFGGMGLLAVLFAGAMIAVDVMAGHYLMNDRRRTFCMVIAAINCMSFPAGTALGVFTFIVLARPGVQARFEAAQGSAKT
jgi:hypothetical protein